MKRGQSANLHKAFLPLCKWSEEETQDTIIRKRPDKHKSSIINTINVSITFYQMVSSSIHQLFFITSY